MQDRKVQPDVISYSAAISACEKGGQWEPALELLQKMQDRKVQPNVISYNAAISACGRACEWDYARRLFAQMNEKHIDPDPITYNVLIEAAYRSFDKVREEDCAKTGLPLDNARDTIEEVELLLKDAQLDPIACLCNAYSGVYPAGADAQAPLSTSSLLAICCVPTGPQWERLQMLFENVRYPA